MSKQIFEPELSIGASTDELSIRRQRVQDPFDRRMLDPTFAKAYRSWLASHREPGAIPRSAYGG